MGRVHDTFFRIVVIVLLLLLVLEISLDLSKSMSTSRITSTKPERLKSGVE